MATNKKSKNISTQVKVQKHRKILRDNIQGITKPALQRLCHRAGIKRISDDIYEELRVDIKVYMEEILQKLQWHFCLHYYLSSGTATYS